MPDLSLCLPIKLSGRALYDFKGLSRVKPGAAGPTWCRFLGLCPIGPNGNLGQEKKQKVVIYQVL